MATAGIDAYDSNGRTPLMSAAERGDLEEVVRLLDLGADPSIKDNGFGTSTAADIAKRIGKRNVNNRIWAEIARVLENAQGFGSSRKSNERSKHAEKVVVTCPSCAQKLFVPADLTGTVTCPTCGTHFPHGTRSNDDQSNNSDHRQNERSTPTLQDSDILAYFETLGLDHETLGLEIKKAYKKRISEYHPDKVSTLGAELREVAERKSKEVNDAYRRLKALGLVK
jgi:uncharacterized Zn finger protein (UPF0148 family)